MAPRSNTKEKIGRAALGLFAAQGLKETTIRDITTAVGISEGAFYRHYPSKEALAERLYLENYRAFAEALDAIVEAEDSFVRRLDAMIGRFCRLFDDDPELFSYLLLAQHSETKKVPKGEMTPVSVLRRSVVEGMARGEIPAADPDVMTAMILGLVLQPAVFKVYGDIDRDMTSLSGRFFEACCRVSGASAEPLP